MTSSSFRASSERAWISPPAASTSFTSGASLSPLRRPAKIEKPSAANFFAISEPMKSPAPITAAVAFRMGKVTSSGESIDWGGGYSSKIELSNSDAEC